jgi:spermidine synthase
MEHSAENGIQYRFNIYLGTFIIAFSTLALEITLSRLLSVITWYHLAFFAVSTAMLGMTAGAITVYLNPAWFTDNKLNSNLAKSCLAYSVSVPVSLVLLCLIEFNAGVLIMKLLGLLTITAACALPFYFSGIAVTAVLTKSNLSIGKLYASDLLGASLGCLFVLAGLEYFDAPSLIILCGVIMIPSVLFFAYKDREFRLRKLSVLILILLLIGASVNFFDVSGIRPVFVKGTLENPKDIIFDKWNSFSRIVVHGEALQNPNWESSPATPPDSLRELHWIIIDGEAGTILLKNKNPEDLSILKYDLTNIAYYLKEGSESACIIGIGGGKDIQTAWLFGIKKIIGIDINPIFVDLLKNKFRNESKIADLPNVEMIVDEARSYLSRSNQKFSLIQMSLADTWASTGAGAFSLSENALYTVEAWKIILNHLDQNGLFTVSRWYSPNNLGETGRMVSLGVSSLLHSGVREPSKHIAMMCEGKIATLILSKSPFNETEKNTLRTISENLKFDEVINPDEPPSNNILREIVSVKSENELINAIKDKPLNFYSPTDDDPYFFNMLRLTHLNEVGESSTGILHGNLTATITLLVLVFSLLVLSVITIIFPLVVSSKIKYKDINDKEMFWKGAAYFSLIGAGFMMTEIGLIQRLSVFLGHPVYALGILLFTILLSAGTGSFTSEFLPLTSKPWKYILPSFAAIMIIVIKFVLNIIMSGMVSSPELIKIIISIIVIFPLGFVMGMFFPTGMKLVKSNSESQTPWFWGLNGIFGVLFSALAVFFSIYSGISTNFYIASVCYILIVFLVTGISKKTEIISES